MKDFYLHRFPGASESMIDRDMDLFVFLYHLYRHVNCCLLATHQQKLIYKAGVACHRMVCPHLSLEIRRLYSTVDLLCIKITSLYLKFIATTNLPILLSVPMKVIFCFFYWSKA